MGLDNKSSDVFEVRGKLEYPGNTLSQSTEQQSQPTISIQCGIKPGLHWWKLLPKSYFFADRNSRDEKSWH